MLVSGQLHALGRLLPQEATPSTHRIGGWVDPRGGLNMMAKRKISCPCQELNQPIAKLAMGWMNRVLYGCMGAKHRLSL